MTTRTDRPVVIVGAGAAGLMAAIFAARGPRHVLLLEGGARPGHKILISGGGRCNVLPLHASPEDYVTDGSRHAVAKILRAWSLREVRVFFEEELGVPLQLDPGSDKLFPATNRARSVLDALLAAASRGGVELRLGARVIDLQPGDGWVVRLASGEAIAAARVVLATGGLSVPATGSDGTGLQIARGLGHTLVPPYPALTPLTGSNPAHRELAGVSLRVALAAQGGRQGEGGPGGTIHRAQGGFLFTHHGYSGPAVLNLSHIVARSLLEGWPRPALFVKWAAPDGEVWDARLREHRGPLISLLREEIPERLAAQLLAESGLTGIGGAQLRRDQRSQLVEHLVHYRLPWSGHEGYKAAEVTGGGIALAEIDTATLESRVAPGLHLCGEMLDAFGPIGGYNFLWAWVTGRIAGSAGNRQLDRRETWQG